MQQRRLREWSRRQFCPHNSPSWARAQARPVPPTCRVENEEEEEARTSAILGEHQRRRTGGQEEGGEGGEGDGRKKTRQGE
eukprot:533580-Hanusia_phi.AAC.1